MKADAKIDMLHQYGAFNGKAHATEETEIDEEDGEADEIESTVPSSKVSILQL